MSFSFNTVGSKDEVLAQLAKVDVYGNAIGEEARLLVLNSLSADKVQPYDGFDLKYTVTASGHSGGGSPLSLNLTVTGTYVPHVEAPPVVQVSPPTSVAAPTPDWGSTAPATP